MEQYVLNSWNGVLQQHQQSGEVKKKNNLMTLEAAKKIAPHSAVTMAEEEAASSEVDAHITSAATAYSRSSSNSISSTPSSSSSSSSLKRKERQHCNHHQKSSTSEHNDSNNRNVDADHCQCNHSSKQWQQQQQWVQQQCHHPQVSLNNAAENFIVGKRPLLELLFEGFIDRPCIVCMRSGTVHLDEFRSKGGSFCTIVLRCHSQSCCWQKTIRTSQPVLNDTGHRSRISELPARLVYSFLLACWLDLLKV